MSESNHDELAVEAAATLGREAATMVHTPEHVTDHLLVVTCHDELTTQTIDFERYADHPARQRGDTVVHDPKNFAEVVNRHALDGRTTTWCDLASRRVVAVLNDQDAVDAEPGWRDHTVTLALQVDPEWEAWTGRSGKLGTQESFAEFLEEHTTSIVSPAAADLLEIATTFQATRGVTFKQGTRLSSGEVQLTYEETTNASAGRRGQLEVPERIELSLSPYVGALPSKVIARVRWRIDPSSQKLAIGFTLLRPDTVEREAFDRVRQAVVEGLNGVPTYLGPAPEPIKAR